MATNIQEETGRRGNNAENMLVNFMIIGAQKCATDSLVAQLTTHYGICFSKIKEPAYFNQLKDWREELDTYHDLFAPENGQICGEASTMYTFLPEMMDTYRRLYEYNAELKLIYIMRQPVERVVSHYAHRLALGRVESPLEEAVFECLTYINRSRYGVQIRPYLELFPRHQILLLIFEDYVTNQRQTLSQIADFLKIDPQPFGTVESVHKHKSAGEWHLANDRVRRFVNTNNFQSIRSYIPVFVRKPIRRLYSNRLQEKPRITPEVKQMIWRFVEDDVFFIETLLERRLDEWRQGYDR